jgi:16S rRNA (guanine966-N2)-methyltransferase
MSDKARGAIFSALGDIVGLTVLDAFAGSGALSIEAISRGAASALAIDIDKEAYQTIQANVEQLGLKEKIFVMRKNIGGWTRNNQHKQFDIVLADPPYNDINPTILQKLVGNVKPQGLFVLSWPGKEKPRPFNGLTLLSTNKHGDAQLVFYRKES